MDIEHIGYVVEDPVRTAQWYVEHLGLRVVRRGAGPALGHFLADGSGRVMIEIYKGLALGAPDYRRMDPRLLHLAFRASDVEEVRARLIAAGAAPEGEVVRTPEGDTIATLRDPWGFPVQLARRAGPMV